MSSATSSFIEIKPTAKKPRPMSFDAFYKKYAARAGGFKYEWNDGFIEKSEALKQEEFYIATNLTKFFFQFIEPRIGGTLIQEVETWTSNTKWRKPDLAFYTSDQMMDIDKKSMLSRRFALKSCQKTMISTTFWIKIWNISEQV